MLFADFTAEWLKACVLGGGLTESQMESDTSILQNHLVPFFKETLLDAFSSRLIDHYKAAKRTQKHQYGRGYSAKSINNHLSVLHRIFEKAIEYELVEKNPVTRKAWLRRDKTSEDSRNWWTPEDERKAIETLEAWKKRYPMRRLLILIQVMTGLRFSELRALEPRDVDMSTPGLWVRRSMARKIVGTPKNKRARFQVIPRSLAGELEAWMNTGGMETHTQRLGERRPNRERLGLACMGDVRPYEAQEGFLFPGANGGALANNSLNRWYRQLARQAEIAPISSHGARHTSGSDYALMGVGQKMIAKLLGHINTSATERYTHVQVTETQALVERRWAELVNVRLQ